MARVLSQDELAEVLSAQDRGHGTGDLQAGRLMPACWLSACQADTRQPGRTDDHTSTCLSSGSAGIGC